jgi:hypothetical protein
MQTWHHPPTPPAGPVAAPGGVPGGPPPNDSRDEPGGRFPETFTLVAAAALGAVIVLAGLLAWQDRRPGEEVATGTTTTSQSSAPSSTNSAPTTATPTTQPSSTTTSASGPSGTIDPSRAVPLPCPAGVDRAICDAAAYVQQVRERQFKTFPPVELLTDAEFDRALLADFEDSRAELDDEGVTLSALGLLDPTVSLADAYRDALEIGVVGFYDPKTGRLVVRADSGEGRDGFNLYVRQVLVHELTHALDDQWFDLDREDFVDGDAEYGFVATVEGDARRVDERWQSELDPAARQQLQQDSLAAVSPDDMVRYFSLPPVLQQLQLSPYTNGLAYMRRVVEGGGEAAADQALINPPATSEDIFRPDRPRASDPEVVLGPPEAGGAAVTTGRLGQLVVNLWLGSDIGDGWGGDRYVTWRDGPRSCIAVDLAADTPKDLSELDRAARSWAAARPADRSVTAGTSGSAPVVSVRGCAG